MRTKLTVTMDDALVRRAKTFARKKGTTVSQVVAEYFASLDYRRAAEFDESKLPPITRSLLGCAKGAGVTEEDYIDYLEEKYR